MDASTSSEDSEEKHQEDENGQANAHDHVALSTGTSFRYLPVKRALLIRHGLATHWSRHHGYNTMVRYLTVPSEKKPKHTLDPWPALWDCSGTHSPLIDCVSPPVTQKALESKRLKLIHEAAEKIRMGVFPKEAAARHRGTINKWHKAEKTCRRECR